MSEVEDLGSEVSFGPEPLIEVSDGPDGAPGPPPENPQQQAVPYKEKRFLGAISSFKTPDPLNDENWVA